MGERRSTARGEGGPIVAYLTDILIVRKVLPIELLDRVSADEDDEPFIRDLVTQGVVTEVQFASARAEKLGFPFVELLDYPVDRASIALVPAAVCRRYGVLPVGIVEGKLLLAMVDPGNVFALDDVRSAARMTIKPLVAERGDLAAARSASSEIMRTAREQGMLTLREDAWAKVRLGRTSIEEIMRVVA